MIIVIKPWNSGIIIKLTHSYIHLNSLDFFLVVDVAANGGDYNQMIRTEGVLMQVSYTCKVAYMYMHHTLMQT